MARSVNSMKILIITNFVPYPPTTGAGLRVFNLLKHISQRHEVHLLSLFNPWRSEDQGVAHLETLCAQVEVISRRPRSRLENWRRLLWGTLRGESRRNVLDYFEGMAERIRELTEDEHFDVVQIHHTHMAPYVKAISPTNHCCKIWFLHNVAHVQFQRMMLVERDWRVKQKLFLNWLLAKRATLKYARLFDTCIAVSEIDRDFLKQDVPDLNVVALPGGVDIEDYPFLAEQSQTPSLLYVGNMHYPPNVDAVIFFCEEIFPLIKHQVPDVKLLIVGKDPRGSVQALASEDVVVTGYVESVIPYYQQSLVSVVPLRAGGGTRLKIPEAMALGCPVVSTTVGCEGLSVTHGENILIADAPADFATQTVRLLQDEALRQRIAVNGRRLVETTYDWRAVAQRLMWVYEQVVDER